MPRSDTNSETSKGLRKEAEREARGYPLNNDTPLHPTRTVLEANAYKRADATRHDKES